MQSSNQWAKKTNGVHPPLVGSSADGNPAMAAHQSLQSPARRAARPAYGADAPPRGRRSSDAAASNVQYGLCAYGTGRARWRWPRRRARPVASRATGTAGADQRAGGAHLGSANDGGQPRAPRIGAVVGVGRYGYQDTPSTVSHARWRLAATNRIPPCLLFSFFVVFSLTHSRPPLRPAPIRVADRATDGRTGFILYFFFPPFATQEREERGSEDAARPPQGGRSTIFSLFSLRYDDDVVVARRSFVAGGGGARAGGGALLQPASPPAAGCVVVSTAVGDPGRPPRSSSTGGVVNVARRGRGRRSDGAGAIGRYVDGGVPPRLVCVPDGNGRRAPGLRRGLAVDAPVVAPRLVSARAAVL